MLFSEANNRVPIHQSAGSCQAIRVLPHRTLLTSLLMGTRTCFTDNPSGSGGWASVGAIINGGYTLSTFECGVSLFRTPFPEGSILTVTVWSNHPVWVQVDSSPTTVSYETFNVISPAQPQMVDPISGTVAARTIMVDAYSD